MEKGGLEDCNPCSVPIQPNMKLSKERKEALVDATEFGSLVGSLRYLVNTRPDLTFSAGYVSRCMEKPRGDHLAAVKHILRYIARTLNVGLLYPRGKEESAKLLGYSDSDLVGDLDSRKSTTGVSFLFGRSAISWQSTKQRVVPLSRCERLNTLLLQ